MGNKIDLVSHVTLFEPPHDKTNKMVVRPAAPAQSDQSLRCLHEETLGP